jgi:hypothetical protein
MIINLGSNKDNFGDIRIDPQDPKGIQKAAWVYDGVCQFSGTGEGANIFDMGKEVECIDFSKFLKQFEGQEIIVKMDIEGAEYDILEKMIKDGTDKLVKEFWIEWHISKFPEKIHIQNNLKKKINWKNWHTIKNKMRKANKPKVLIDPNNLEVLCYRDADGQWWKRNGKCNKCGICCKTEGYCEYLKNNICQIRLKYPGIRNLACFLGPFPDTKFKIIKEKCNYKWVKTSLKRCLDGN